MAKLKGYNGGLDKEQLKEKVAFSSSLWSAAGISRTGVGMRLTRCQALKDLYLCKSSLFFSLAAICLWGSDCS